MTYIEQKTHNLLGFIPKHNTYIKADADVDSTYDRWWLFLGFTNEPLPYGHGWKAAPQKHLRLCPRCIPLPHLCATRHIHLI